ncbi:hypothetical protein HT102_15070 [Hoyosella sp. G463]|uniref:Uncharacterized protein n=1 Tax=Lolliginicoccus lacisalsi TaxID=2742202 RepID=A0A927JEI4_9ACTN|nr:hypothetical protein [Lolliginicoccus lacisalsi]MBD8507809.1 hypothetical protein [Lolliginicoccus lacisalsi]
MSAAPVLVPRPRADEDAPPSPASGSTEALASACLYHLGAPASWISAQDHARSLALCLIESVQSASTGFVPAAALVARYQGFRRATALPATPLDHDGLAELLATFALVGGPTIWIGKVGHYRQRYSGSIDVRAAEILHLAHALLASRIGSSTELLRAVGSPGGMEPLAAIWLAELGAPGERALAHCLALASPAPGAVARAREAFRAACAPGTDALTFADKLADVAAELGAGPERLDHAMVRWHAGRDPR